MGIERVCLFCGSGLVHTFVDLGLLPVSIGLVALEKAEKMEPFYPLHAYVCDSCWLVQLGERQSARKLLSNHSTSLSCDSSSRLEEARQYAAMAIGRFGLNANSRVVQVASGDGYLLQHFVAAGIPVLGIDHAVQVAAVVEKRGIPTWVERFGTNTAQELVAEGKQADLLIGNDVLACAEALNDFVAGLKAALKPTGVMTLEFPHLLQLIERNQFEAIGHEHYSYFSLLTVEKLLAAHGLVLFDVDEISSQGGSLRIYAGHADSRSRGDRVDELLRKEVAAGLNGLPAYRAFADKVRETKRQLLEFLIAAKRSGKSVVAYGLPAQGNTLLNYCGIGRDFIDYTVDRSVQNQGHVLPGTRIPVCAPELIGKTRPDYVLILPWNLRDEVMEQMAWIGEWGGQFVVAVPHLQIFRAGLARSPRAARHDDQGMSSSPRRACIPAAHTLLQLYRSMSLIRQFEERLKWLVETGVPVGVVHLSIGQEAVPAGVCAALEPEDWISSTHRGHGHCIAKGVEVGPMMAELFGKATGTNRGKGGSMHITDSTKHILGVNPIIGAGVAHALGAALSAKIRKTREVAVAFFGDGAAGIGTLHEAMNMAAIWKLPIVFVCENNGYAQATPFEYACPLKNIADRAGAYAMPGAVVDGQDVLAVWEAAKAAVERTRAGGGPSLLECKTYRYYGHHQGDETLRYRTADEEKAARNRDCLVRFRTEIPSRGLVSLETLDEIDAQNKILLDKAVEFAKESPLPEAKELLTDVYVPNPSRSPNTPPPAGTTRELSFGQAINEALRQEMARDERVIVMGEDVAGAAGRASLGLIDAWGGPLRATRGLIKEFGPERVIDTPISEMGFVGAAVGAAMTGLRPVVEIMFVDLIGVCYDQIVNQAAKMHYMTGGKLSLPIVIRTAYGTRGDKRSYGGGAAAHHSQTLYATLAHIPGLKVVVPSNAYNAKGLTIAAIRDNGPVVILEHKFLGLKAKGPVPTEPYLVLIGQAEIVRRGNDVTLVGIGRMTQICLEAADQLLVNGVSAEVVDLLTIAPLDEETIFESVRRTHHLVVVDEDTPVASIGRDIAARVVDACFDYLDAPIKVITAAAAPVPFAAVLELLYSPRVEQVIAAVSDLLNSGLC